jgi:NTP pyrophosphatase (non-canonical NTP hydrolase)
VIKARWEQLRQWMRGWKPVSTREYEALAREFGMITARCLQAEDSLRAVRINHAAMRKQMERDRAAVYGELPGLTPGEVERLAILAEECGEVATAVGKILRFGWESQSPYGGKPNRKALEQELGNVRAVVNLMLDAGDLNLNAIQSWQRNKRVALMKWTLYQECSMGREQQLEMIRSIAESATGG